MSKTSFYQLTISKIVRETPEASTLYFNIPEEHKTSFSRKAGQYLTLETEIEGEKVRRAYSICTGVYEEKIGVTVKTVHGGLMSTYINEKVVEGQLFDVMPPEGNFTVNIDPDKKRNHVFIAAGSGITPVMSMIKSVLEEEAMSVCHLIYGNRNINTIIFKKDLEQLQEMYKGQLFIEHVLSRPVLKRQPGVSGFFKKPLPEWAGKTGRIESGLVEEYLNEKKINKDQAEYYICGPGEMIVSIEKHLKESVANKKQVHVEYFSAPEGDQGKSSTTGSGAVEVQLEGKTYHINVPADKTILDVLIEEEGAEPPYSCTSGACSSCMAKVTQGKVSMDACFALDEEEVAEGYILTCQAHPNSENVKIDFEQ